MDHRAKKGSVRLGGIAAVVKWRVDIFALLKTWRKEFLSALSG